MGSLKDRAKVARKQALLESPTKALAHAWMSRHPEAMKILEEMALQMARRKQKFGIDLLTARVRWEFKLRPEPVDEFKLSNNYRPYLARELIRRHPVLEDFITIHRSAADQ